MAQGASSGIRSVGSNGAKIGELNKRSTARTFTGITPSDAGPDVNQVPSANARNKLKVAPAVYSGREQIPVQQVAAGAGGHHWLPQSVFGNVKSSTAADAFEIFKAGTKATDPYRHGFDTWNGLTHDGYIKDTRALLDDWIRANGGRIERCTAEEFLSWITESWDSFGPGYSRRHRRDSATSTFKDSLPGYP
jgi:hypothetical protein